MCTHNYVAHDISNALGMCIITFVEVYVYTEGLLVFPVTEIVYDYLHLHYLIYL